MDPITFQLEVSWDFKRSTEEDEPALAVPIQIPFARYHAITNACNRPESLLLHQHKVQEDYDIPLGSDLSKPTYFCYFFSAKSCWKKQEFITTHSQNCTSNDLDIPLQFRLRNMNPDAFDFSNDYLRRTMINLYQGYKIYECHGYTKHETPCLGHALLAACRITELSPPVPNAFDDLPASDLRINIKTLRLRALLLHSLNLYLAPTLKYWCPEASSMYHAILNSSTITDFHLRMLCCILNIGCFTAIQPIIPSNIGNPIDPAFVIFTGPDGLANPFAVFESDYRNTVHQTITSTPATIAIALDPCGPATRQDLQYEAPFYGRGYVAHALQDHTLHNLPLLYLTVNEVTNLEASKDQDPHAILRLCAISFPHLIAEDPASLRAKPDLFHATAQVMLSSPDDLLHKLQAQTNPCNTLVLYKELFSHLHGPGTLKSLRHPQFRKFLQEHDEYYLARGTRPMLHSIDPPTLALLKQAWERLRDLALKDQEEREYEAGIKCGICWELINGCVYKCTARCVNTFHFQCLRQHRASVPIYETHVRCSHCRTGYIDNPVPVAEPVQVIDLTGDDNAEAGNDDADNPDLLPAWDCAVSSLFRHWKDSWSNSHTDRYLRCLRDHWAKLKLFYVHQFQPHILATDTLKGCTCFNFTREPCATLAKYLREFTAKLMYCDIDDAKRKYLFLQGIPTTNITFRGFISPYIDNPAYTFEDMYQAATLELSTHPSRYVITVSKKRPLEVTL